MKNKKMLLGIIIAIMLMVSLVILTGCKNNEENSINNGNGEQNISEKSDKKQKDDSTVKFSYITSNNANTVALDTEGNVWTWGKNSSGQLGNGTTTDNDIPQKVFENASMISTGRDSVLVITKDNELYSWGSGFSHKLPKIDYNNTDNYLVPTKYESDIKFVYAECGKSNGSMAIDVDGNRYVWGGYTNLMGVEPFQIGQTSAVIPYYPLKVENDTIKFKDVYFYGNGSFVIDEEGNLYGPGAKDISLGFSTSENSVSKYTQIAEGTKFKEICPQAKYCLALDVDGNIWAWGEKNDITAKQSDEAFKLTSDKKYKSIAFNNFINKTAYAIDEDGNLYIIGGQNNPQGAFMITQEGSIYNLPQFPASLDHVVAIWFNNCLNVFFNTTWFTWHFGDTQWTNFGV